MRPARRLLPETGERNEGASPLSPTLVRPTMLPAGLPAGPPAGSPHGPPPGLPTGLNHPARAVLLLILVATLVRIGFGSALGLGVDESYMVAAGRALSLGYFDHPPASWWLSWGAAHLAGSEAPIVVRLPFIALAAVSTWLMYRLGAALADPRAGFCAALLLTLSPVFGITTGTWVLPDGPLDCALLGAALCLMRALSTGPRPWAWWLGAGVCAGLALFSKYSAALTIGGAAVFLLSSPRHRAWLRRPEPWLAALAASLLFAPVLLWNASHGWASFAFQGGRATGLHLRPLAPFGVLAGEALFVLPWIWLPLMAAFIAALRRGRAAWRSWLLCCLGAPPIAAFALIAAWSNQRVLFHWAAPGYLLLMPLLGAEVAQRLDRPAVRRALIGTAAFACLVLAVVATQVRLDWLHPVLAAVTTRDPDVEAITWTSLRDDLAARGLLQSGTVVGVPNWRDAGKIAYALGPDVTVLCLNRDARQFGVVAPAAAHRTQDVLVLVLDHPERAAAELAPLFERVEPLPPAAIRFGGRAVREVSVFWGRRLQ